MAVPSATEEDQERSRCHPAVAIQTTNPNGKTAGGLAHPLRYRSEAFFPLLMIGNYAMK